MSIRVSDPVERVIANALDARGIRYVVDGEGDTKQLDFYVPEWKVYIEVKQFHTDRVAEQMSRADNVIVIQGMQAAFVFAELIDPT